MKHRNGNNSKSPFSAATIEKGKFNDQNPLLQHMNHTIVTFKNHLLQHPKNPPATRRKQQKAYKTARG
jgi:hypothetical protein